MDWTLVISWLLEHGIRILLIIIIAVALYWALHHFVPVLIKRGMERTMKGQPEDEIKERTVTLSTVMVDTGIAIIAIISLFIILAEVGLNMGPALAGLGVIGVAIGFGAQSLIKDIFNGLFILFENQYCIGDWVSIAGVDGLVENINLRRTVIRDFNGSVHSIPNGEIKVSTNFTKEWARINMNISVGYGEDLNRVIEVINGVGEELAKDPDWECDFMEPPYALRVEAFEDSGIAIKVIGKVRQMRQWAIMGELRLRLKRAFDKENIEIPWPHTKVFFGNVPVETGIKELIEPKPPLPSPTEKHKRPTRPALHEEDSAEIGD